MRLYIDACWCMSIQSSRPLHGLAYIIYCYIQKGIPVSGFFRLTGFFGGGLIEPGHERWASARNRPRDRSLVITMSTHITTELQWFTRHRVFNHRNDFYNIVRQRLITKVFYTMQGNNRSDDLAILMCVESSLFICPRWKQQLTSLWPSGSDVHSWTGQVVNSIPGSVGYTELFQPERTFPAPFRYRQTVLTVFLSTGTCRNPVAYRGFLAPGAKMGISAPLGVSDWHASKAISLTIWGSGVGPQPPTRLRAFWCEWNLFLNSVNTIFNSACQTGKRQRCSPSILEDLGRSPSRQRFWGYLGVNGAHFWIPLHICQLGVSDCSKLRRALPCYLGSAFGCKWNSFLNRANTIFNSVGAHCGPAACGFIVIMPFGNSRRGATDNDTGACRLTHIGGIGHVLQNVSFYVLLLHRDAKI